MPLKRKIKRLTLVLAVLALAPAFALTSALAQNPANPSPPVQMGGFSYQFIPQTGTHMNICQRSECVPGSKVSYIIYPPTSELDFETFKATQKQLLPLLEERAPKGSVIIMGEPERSEDQLFTLFTNDRETRTPDGKRHFVKSTFVFAEAVTISIISSSSDKEAVETNRALFLVGLMAWGQALANHQENATPE